MDKKPATLEHYRKTFTLFRRLKRWRKRDFIFYWGPLLAVCFVTYLRLTAPRPSISRDIYERVAAGMTEREVERIVGTRPGGYEMFSGSGKQLSREWADPERVAHWGNRYGILSVGYSLDRRVCSKQLEYHPYSVPEHPELWPWWKRLVNRSIPEREPARFYISF